MNVLTPRSFHRVVLAASAVVATAALLAGCGSSDTKSTSGAAAPKPNPHFDRSAADKLPAAIKSNGEIHIASGPGYPPFLDVASDGKTLTGAQIEEMRLVGEVLGVKMVFDDIKFDAVFAALKSRKTDGAAMSLGVTAERLESVDFVSDYKGGTSLLVAAGNPKKIAFDTLCGHTVAALKGSIYTDKQLPTLEKACTGAGKPSIKVSTFPASADAVLALSSGRVEATMTDLGPAVYQAKQSNGKLEALDVNYDPTVWGIAVPKGSDLEPALQAALNSLMKSGAYLENLKRFGVEAGAIDKSDIYTSADQLGGQ